MRKREGAFGLMIGAAFFVLFVSPAFAGAGSSWLKRSGRIMIRPYRLRGNDRIGIGVNP